MAESLCVSNTFLFQVTVSGKPGSTHMPLKSVVTGMGVKREATSNNNIESTRFN